MTRSAVLHKRSYLFFSTCMYFLIADPPEYVIKRVIALEGDEVETSAASSVVLKRGAAWVEGDNALNSIDSNTYGPICLGLVVGKASHVVWPPGHLHSVFFIRDSVKIALGVSHNFPGIFPRCVPKVSHIFCHQIESKQHFL